jgi:AcrR family transcriptional regulator
MIRKRRYTLSRRAESQAETRRRIVEATVALHSEIGPAHASISAIAERAGVQRHTVYAHFPEERDLPLACSAMALERDPLPDESAWIAIAGADERLRSGLTDLYRWYSRNAALATCVLRDAEFDPMTRYIVDLRMGPHMKAYEQVLGQKLGSGREVRAALALALKFQTWRTLSEDGGLSLKAAVDLMVRAIRCAGQ